MFFKFVGSSLSFFSSVQRDRSFFSVHSDFFCSDFQKLQTFRRRTQRSSLALNHKFLMFPKVGGRPKGPPLVFFGTMRHFFRNFLNSLKGYPLNFFEVVGLSKTFNEPKGSIFGVFGIMRLFYQISFEKFNFSKGK